MASLIKPLSVSEVRDLMAKQLKDSGLSVADCPGYKPHTTQSCATTYPELKHIGAGYAIPYFDLNGKATQFFRYRYVTHPSLRYVQPPNVLPQVYWSRLTPWKKVLADKDEPLFVTEGEKKADCGCKNGFATIGLGGVWSFKSGVIALIRELADIDWVDRRVYIVFDSDGIEKPGVRAAELELGRQLLEKKALVHTIRLPQSDSHKVGLDDFLVDNGSDEFQRLVDEDSEEFSNSVALHELNQLATVIVRSAEVLTLRNNAIYSFQKFEKLFAKYKHTIIGADEKASEKATAKEWLAWRGHNEVERPVYEPGKPRLIPADPYPDYNLWSGWGVEPEEGDISPFLELMNFLFQECTHEEKEWFLDWLAWPLKYPGDKMSSSVLIHGTGQGTGKSLLGEIVGKIYGDNYSEIDDSDLISSFNEWCRHKQFVLGNEIGAKYKKAADLMKNTITRENVTINSKFVAQYQIRDCINYYFTSQKPDAAYLEDDDRRHFVVNAPDKAESDSFYKKIRAFKYGRGPSHLLNFLLNRDLSAFGPKVRPPMTAAKARMIVTGRSDQKAWAINLRDNGHPMLAGKLFVTPKQLKAIFVDDNSSPKSLGSDNLMSTVLAEAGFKQTFAGAQVYLGKKEGKQRFWIVDQKLNPKFAGKDADTEFIKNAYLKERNNG